MAMRRAMVAAALLALSGCAMMETAPSPDHASVVAATLMTRFSLSGRFSAKTAAEQVSGQFRYTENDSERTLNLFSPLGTPLADINASRDRATLTQANGGSQTASSLSALLRTVIDLPVTDAMLSAWLQGLPSTAVAASDPRTERDGAGLLTRIVEAGWMIEISARMPAEPGKASAPRRMRWSLAGLPETEVRWAIDDWSTP